MAQVKQISGALTRLLKEYKGANLTLRLPSKALADIGKANSDNVFGQAVGNIASRYPNGVATITSEIGDQFVKAKATMQNGEDIVGNLEFRGDANILQAIRDAISWQKLKDFKPIKVCDEIQKKTLANPTKQIKNLSETKAFKNIEKTLGEYEQLKKQYPEIFEEVEKLKLSKK